MEIGGSQLNAIELAAEVARSGNEVVVFGPAGDLVPVVRAAGLDYVAAPCQGRWPTRRTIAALTDLARTRDVDVVHGYEWGPSVELSFGPHRRWGIPMVTTVLSMSVPDFLPMHTPLVVGTAELAAAQAARGRDVHLIEPPIDTRHNAPSDPEVARKAFDVDRDELVVTVVCRMTTELEKVQGVLGAIEAVDRLAARLPVRLLAVGDGPDLHQVRVQAGAVNRRHGRDVVLVPGGLLDPRDAYASADVVLGMGSSALKGLAFAKPLVVQGAGGFWRTLDERSLRTFLDQGWYGQGGDGADQLERLLDALFADPSRRRALGEFGLRLVRDRFSLQTAADRLLAVYDGTVSRPVPSSVRRRSLARTAKEVVKFKVKRAGQDALDRRRRHPVPAGGRP